MFIPLGVSTYGKRTPWANVALMGACVAGFFLSVQGDASSFFRTYALWTSHPSAHQFVTHLFLHAGWVHLIGNMIFLWAFGNAVNGRVNHAAYLAFFLVAGVAAAAGELYLTGLSRTVTEAVDSFANETQNPLFQAKLNQIREQGIPMVGASGAIMGVAGLCMVLFPFNPARVVLFVVFWPLRFQVKTLFLVLLYAALDLACLLYFGQTLVAYTAHLVGFAVGVLAGIGLILAGWVDRDGYDLLAILRRRGRLNPDPPKPPAGFYDPRLDRVRRG